MVENVFVLGLDDHNARILHDLPHLDIEMHRGGEKKRLPVLELHP